MMERASNYESNRAMMLNYARALLRAFDIVPESNDADLQLQADMYISRYYLEIF